MSTGLGSGGGGLVMSLKGIAAKLGDNFKELTFSKRILDQNSI